jgi:outer membrane protein TolC
MKKLLFLTLPLYVFAGNLNQLLDETINNQLVQSSKYNVDAIKESYKSVQNSYMPKVTLGATYSNTNKETASTADSSLVSYAKIDYTLYDGNAKNNKYKSLESSIKSGEKNINSLKNKLSLEVITLYFNYLSLQANKEATKQEIKTLHAQQQRLEKFLKVGTTTEDEVQKITSHVHSANVTLHQIELSLQTILHNLSYLTNKETTITNGSKITLIEDKNLFDLRSDIKALELDLDKLKANAKASKSSNLPLVTLDNTFYKYNMDYDNTAYDNGLDTQNIFKVNLAWKIFDFGATNDTYNSNYKLYLGAKSNYEYEKSKANVDLQLAIKAHKIAQMQIESTSLALKAANATYNAIESKYQSGLVNNVAYLEALSEKSNAISQLQNAKNNLEIKKANILYHSGKNLWEYVK